jgi:legumain
MWMEDSEKEDLTQETLFRQFAIVRKETNTSHVQVDISLKDWR